LEENLAVVQLPLGALEVHQAPLPRLLGGKDDLIRDSAHGKVIQLNDSTPLMKEEPKVEPTGEVEPEEQQDVEAQEQDVEAQDEKDVDAEPKEESAEKCELTEQQVPPLPSTGPAPTPGLESQEDRLPASAPASGSTAKEQRKADRLQARTQLRPFLQRHGFQTVKSKKSFLWRFSYPLHVAVKINDVEAVELLLRAGADAKRTNSAGETPQQLAKRIQKGNSHAAVMAALERKANSRTAGKAPNAASSSTDPAKASH